MGNKYLEKISGLPITETRLPLIAKTLKRQGQAMIDLAASGKSNTKKLMSLGSSQSRLNRNVPKELVDKLTQEQINSWK